MIRGDIGLMQLKTARQATTAGVAVGAVRTVRRPSQVVVEAKRRSSEAITAAKMAKRVRVVLVEHP